MARDDSDLVLGLSYRSDAGAAARVFALGGSASISESAMEDFPVAGLTTCCWLRTGQEGDGTIWSYTAEGRSLRAGNPADVEVSFSSASTGTSSTGPTGVRLADGRWHQLVVVVAPSAEGYYQVQIYLDACLAYISQGSLRHAAGEGLAPGGDLVLGAGGEGSGFQGEMSEFELWRGVRSGLQVATGLERRAEEGEADLVLAWPLDEPPEGASQEGGEYVASTLRFRDAAILASWEGAPGTTYELELQAVAGGWFFEQGEIEGSELTVLGVLLNQEYLGRVRATGEESWGEAAGLVPFDRGQVALVVAGSLEEQTLVAQWPAVDQAEGFEVVLLEAGAAVEAAEQGTTSFDLTDYLGDDALTQIEVRALASGSRGPANEVGEPAVAELTVVAVDAGGEGGGYLDLSWSPVAGASYYYGEVFEGSASVPFFHRLFAGDRTGVEVPVELITGTEDRVRLRAVGEGSLGSWAERVLTVQVMAGPVLLPLQADGTGHTIEASWTFDGEGLSDLSYRAELWLSPEERPEEPIEEESVSVPAVTFTSAAIVDGVSFAVRVRAVSGDSLGAWSQEACVTVGSGLEQVTQLSVDSTSAGDLTAGWAEVGGEGVSYELQLEGPEVAYGRAEIPATSVELLQAETGVVPGSVYTLRVRATDGTSFGPWSEWAEVTVGEETPGDPGDEDGGDSTGDPIHLARGSFTYRQPGIEVIGRVPLAFVCSYNSRRPRPEDHPSLPSTPMGARWTHSFNTLIETSEDGTRAAVQWGDGTVHLYRVPPSVTGTYSKLGVPTGDTLLRRSDLSFQLTRRDQSRYLFSSTGVLQWIVSPAGNRAELAYDGAGRLSSVTDEASGRALTLTYDGEDRVDSVTDSAGHFISFGYQGADLVRFTDVQGEETTFSYDSSSLILTITDALGQTFVSNTYDEQQRVVFQQDARAVASGEDYGIEIVYHQLEEEGEELLRATVTDRMGYLSEFVSNGVTGKTLSAFYELGGGEVRRITRVFDAAGNLLSEEVFEGPESVAGDGGNITAYSYDGVGNVLTETDPLGRTTLRTYDEANHLLTQIDPLGNETTFRWSGNDLAAIVDPLGREMTLSYLAGSIGGLVATVNDFLGNVTELGYDGKGDLTTLEDPLGNTTVFAYDEDGRTILEETLDDEGELLRRLRFQRIRTGQIRYRYVSFAGQADEEAYRWRKAYDEVGRVRLTRNPLGDATTYEYDADDQLSRVVYPTAAGEAEQITEHFYDRNGNRVRTVFSEEVAVERTYDALGRRTRYVDGRGGITDYAYGMDVEGSAPYPTTETTTTPEVEVDGRLERYQSARTFDPAGRWIALTDRRSLTTNFEYQTVPGEQAETFDEKVVTSLPPADPDRPQERYTSVAVYDPLGRILSRTDQEGNVWTTAYGKVEGADATFSETVTVTDPLGNQTVRTFDPLGRLAERRVGAGETWRQTAYAYDALGRLIRVEQPGDSGEVLLTTYDYSYDAESGNQLVTVTPYGQLPSVFAYDGAGRWVESVGASGQRVQLGYTPRGQLQSYLDARGQTLSYRYDGAGRFVSTLLADGEEVFQVLDGNGNRVETRVDGVAAILRTFDSLDRLTSRTDSFGETVGYDYDPTDRVTSLSYPDQRRVTYGYDGLERLVSAADWNGRLSLYSYLATGQLALAELPNGVSVSYQRDAAGRLSALESRVGGELIAATWYQLDAFGEPAAADELLPLAPAGVHGVEAEVELTYEEGTDRLESFDGQPVTYDGDGNMASIPGVAGQLVHNALNQLIAAGAEGYAYDPDGLRIEHRREELTLRFVQDVAGYRSPWVEQADPARGVQGAAPAATVAGPGTLLPLIGAGLRLQPLAAALDRALVTEDGEGAVTARYVHGVGLIGREAADGSFLVYLPDARGSTLALVDEEGRLSDRYAYDSYGRLSDRSGETANPFLYCGQHGVVDDGNGLVFQRARYYSPELLRFLEPDYLFGDALDPQTLNRYAYVSGNPLQWIDPLGLDKDGGGQGGDGDGDTDDDGDKDGGGKDGGDKDGGGKDGGVGDGGSDGGDRPGGGDDDGGGGGGGFLGDLLGGVAGGILGGISGGLLLATRVLGSGASKASSGRGPYFKDKDV